MAQPYFPGELLCGLWKRQGVLLHTQFFVTPIVRKSTLSPYLDILNFTTLIFSVNLLLIHGIFKKYPLHKFHTN